MSDEEQQGGFTWGLTPGGGEPADPRGATPAEPAHPAEPAPAAEPTPPPPLVDPPAPAPTGPPPLVDPLDQPTQAMSAEEFATDLAAFEPPPVEPSVAGPTEVIHPPEIGLPEPPGEGLETAHLEPTDLDHLFGESAFQEVADEPMIAMPTRRLAAAAPPKPPADGMPKSQKILLGIAGGLVAALALVALFLAGTRIAGVLGPAPAVTAEPTPSATASVAPDGQAAPLPPGEHRWDELRGGECLDPFESAWQDRYTVVDCAQPHAAQLVGIGVFTELEGMAYPGMEELQSRINLLCTAPTVIDYAIAGQVNDIQISASYAPDEETWDAGDIGYQCFVSRASGEPLTASVAVPPAPPAG